MVKIAPSILSADFMRLSEELETIKTADYIHFDVMDGLFVPNISFGLPILEAVRESTDMVLDVHLMIKNPQNYVERFCDAGADIVVFHLEAAEPQELFDAIDKVKERRKKVGIALKPRTPAECIMPFINKLDMVLIMTVEPGFGGQSFMEDMMLKVAAVKRFIEGRELNCEIEVDGGVKTETAKVCKKAGADVLVAGSSVFKSRDRASYIRDLRG